MCETCVDRRPRGRWVRPTRAGVTARSDVRRDPFVFGGVRPTSTARSLPGSAVEIASDVEDAGPIAKPIFGSLSTWNATFSRRGR